MSLLNKGGGRFKIPLVFIAGVIFLIVLTFFAKHIENLSESAIDLELPKVENNTNNSYVVTVVINKKLEVYIDSVLTKTEHIENQLLEKMKEKENPTILLQADTAVPSKEILPIMDIGNRNGYKVIIATRSK